MKSTISDLLRCGVVGEQVRTYGWVRTKRVSKNVAFIMLNDGSTSQHLQIAVSPTSENTALLKEVTSGASLAVQGVLVASRGTQALELQARTMELLGKAPSDTYPLQPKKHSLAFLRSITHLRFRTNTYGAVFRIRHAISYAIHDFLHKQGFFYLHTPIITSHDAEGAGDMFGVTAQSDASKAGDQKSGAGHFFGKPVHLTVSGQLAAEAAIGGLGRVYTFGPTFRAENSNTTRHLAEFWMIEPEMAFAGLGDIITLAQELLQGIISHVLEHCATDVLFLAKRALEDEQEAPPLRSQLEQVMSQSFARITYTEAIERLQRAPQAVQQAFIHPVPDWGDNLQGDHERYLVSQQQQPLVITDYPKDIKPFYMRQNDDQRTVAAMDMLLPNIGEVIGGSQREERYSKLLEAIKRLGIAQGPLAWYVDTRRFGTVPHSGFGLGLERMTQFVTGMRNIRDVMPFPRTPGHCMG